MKKKTSKRSHQKKEPKAAPSVKAPKTLEVEGLFAEDWLNEAKLAGDDFGRSVDDVLVALVEDIPTRFQNRFQIAMRLAQFGETSEQEKRESLMKMLDATQKATFGLVDAKYQQIREDIYNRARKLGYSL